ncbi:MAG: hypothetical protein R2851_16795 [Caldilineaceae bacterium]
MIRLRGPAQQQCADHRGRATTSRAWPIHVCAATARRGGGSAYTVRLLARTHAPVAVQAAGDADRPWCRANVEEVGCLLFTPDNWHQPQTVTVAAGNDADVEQGRCSTSSSPTIRLSQPHRRGACGDG